MKVTALTQFLRLSTALSTIALPGALIAQTTAPAATSNDAPVAQEIVVTGSRIARPQVDSAVPIAVVSAKSIQDAGQTNLLDALRDLPIAGQSAGTSASNFSNFDNGVATVNLRNLGDSRTLVLFNGRRTVGIPGDSAVDLNNIPVDLIDHVEVVTGGTSAVYGSDAVAGVVNILLKDKFVGLQLHAQDSITSRGDGASPLFSVLAGKSFSEGRGHIVANVTYTKSRAVPSSARSYSRNDSPTGSAYTPQGAFTTDGGNGDTYTFDSNNNVIPFTGAASQRYNRASQRLLTVGVERFSAALLANYDFGPAAKVYGEFLYNKTKGRGQIEALAADDSGVQGESVYNYDGSPFTLLSSNNPFVPAAIAAAAGPNTDLTFLKRLTGIFDRSPNFSRDYFRGVIGVKGEIGHGWKYDLSYEHSQVRDDTFNGAVLMTNLGAALQATTLNGQTVCADAAARAAGCIPINPFGRQTYTPAQLKFLTTYTGTGVIIPGATPGQQVSSDYLRKNYQDVASLSLTGSLFNLPDGPLGIALGMEFTAERVSEVFDPFTRSGYSSQQLNGNEFGKYNSKEAFIEVSAPILGHRPWVYQLELSGAARYSDYTTIGRVWSYKYGATYAPVPDLHFRAMFARAVRAPNLNELYSPQANTAQQVTDPCDQKGGLGETGAVSPLASGCTNIPGISAYLATHPNFSYTLVQVQTIFGFTGGNPDLKAEATNTFTAGATFTPRFLRNFILTADYYSIKVKNAVSSIDPQTSVTQCFNTGSPDFCALVHRNAQGFITEVDQVNINAAAYKVAGIDVQAIYSFKTHLGGATQNASVDLFYNHKLKQQQTPFVGGAIINELGTADTYASQQLGTGFKDQFTFNANYAIGPVSFHYRLKYLGPVKATNASLTIPIPSYTYHDLQVKFDVMKKLEFYIGANNVFDKQPPFIIGGNSQWPGTNTVADTYDLLGRTLYAGVTVKF
jgi:iron complex outermembrane receptor protein